MQENDNYPEILTDLKQTVTAALQENNIEAQRAEAISHQIAESIRKKWGGQLTYIPKGQYYELNSRDLKIWQEFRGSNHRQLCQKYDISLQRLYQIIKIQRRQMIEKHQHDLFK